MEVIETRKLPGLGRLFLAAGPENRSRAVEFVDAAEAGVPKARRWIITIAVQAGCPVGCTLCDAGAVGYWGNLSADEMLEEVGRVLASNPRLDAKAHPDLQIHFSRMGEPALNPAVLEALARLRAEAGGPGLSCALSTVAPDTPVAESFMERLRAVKDEHYAGGRFELQFSLHGIDERERKRVVPVRTWSFERIADYGRRFRKEGDRKVVLNLALRPGAALDVQALAARFDPAHFAMRLSPVLPTRAAEEAGDAHPWLKPPPALSAFAEALRALGFEIRVGRSAPGDAAAGAACGQLWSAPLRSLAEIRRRNLERHEASYVSAATLGVKAAAWREALKPCARPLPPPNSSGLLIMDMQDSALSPRSPGFLPASRAVARNVARLAAGFRTAGRPVAFAVQGDGRVADILAAREGEPVLRRTSPSGFSHAGLLRWLDERGVRTLVICGLTTDAGVAATARDASALGFDARLPLDACAGADEDLHLAALKTAARDFAFIQSTEEVLRTICPKSC